LKNASSAEPYYRVSEQLSSILSLGASSVT